MSPLDFIDCKNGKHNFLPSPTDTDGHEWCSECGAEQPDQDPPKDNWKMIDKEPDSYHDPVNHPSHYTSHPSGIECIEITRHMGFNLGNAMKYIWRADLKSDALEDLRKAVWYIEDEIKKRESLRDLSKTFDE